MHSSTPVEPIQDRYGDTWSESSSTPSSPQHEARESLESEDLEDMEEERGEWPLYPCGE